MCRSGDRCSCGRGVFDVYCVRTSEGAGVTVRYLKCNACGKTEKQIVPAELIRRRTVKA